MHEPGYLTELPLENLDLSYNNVTGVLPRKLWESSTILAISLNNNKLTGLISQSIGKLHRLQILDIGHNCLEGPIPPSIGALSNFNTLCLDGNRLGSIPWVPWAVNSGPGQANMAHGVATRQSSPGVKPDDPTSPDQ
jgi:Leucine-rich repeat (LRR) protein